MKKLFTLFMVLCFTSVSVFAQTGVTQTEGKLNQLNTMMKDPSMQLKASSSEMTEIARNGQENNDTEEESSCAGENEQDTQECLQVEHELNSFFDTFSNTLAKGNESEMQKMAEELGDLVRESQWLTGKGISKGDLEEKQRILTMFFGFAQIILNYVGYGDVGKNILSEDNKNKVDKMVAYFQKQINSNASGYSTEELLVKVQNNAFVLLFIPPTKLEEMMQRFPELRFLMMDMMFFFKWRADLRAQDDAYERNVNDIAAEFRRATRINSFVTWWILTGIARLKIREEIEGDDSAWQNYTDEILRRQIYDSYAATAKYYGRLWNSVQRYAATKRDYGEKKKERAIDGRLKPINSDFIPESIKRTVKKDYEKLSKKEVVESLKRIRYNYIKTHVESDEIWYKWYAEHKTGEAKNVDTDDAERQLNQEFKQKIDSVEATQKTEPVQKNDSISNTQGDFFEAIEQTEKILGM